MRRPVFIASAGGLAGWCAFASNATACAEVRSRVQVIRVAPNEPFDDGSVWLDLEYSYDFTDIVGSDEQIFIGHQGSVAGDVGPGNAPPLGACRYTTSASGIAFRRRDHATSALAGVLETVNLQKCRAGFENAPAHSHPQDSLDRVLTVARRRYALGDDEGALYEFSKILRVEQSDLDAQLFQAKALENEQQYVDALNSYQTLLQNAPQFSADVVAYLQLSCGRLARKLGKLDDASAYYTAVPVATPSPKPSSSKRRRRELLSRVVPGQGALVATSETSQGGLTSAVGLRTPESRLLAKQKTYQYPDFHFDSGTFTRPGKYIAHVTTGDIVGGETSITTELTDVGNPLTMVPGGLLSGVSFSDLVQFLNSHCALPRSPITRDTDGLWCFGWTHITVDGYPSGAEAVIGVTLWDQAPSHGSSAFKYRFHYGFKPRGGTYLVQNDTMPTNSPDDFQIAATDLADSIDAVLKA